MTPPGRLWHVEYRNPRRDRIEERRYRSELRCAKQVASILAAPDSVAELVGVWCVNGWEAERITWVEVDGRELVDAVSEQLADAAVGLDESENMTPAERRDAIAGAWDYYEEARS